MARIIEVEKVWFHFPDGSGSMFKIGKTCGYFKDSENANNIIKWLEPNVGYLKVVFEDRERFDLYGTFTVSYTQTQKKL